MITTDDFVMNVAMYVIERALKELGRKNTRVYNNGEDVLIKTGGKVISFSPLELVPYVTVKEMLDDVYTKRCSGTIDIIYGLKE